MAIPVPTIADMRLPRHPVATIIMLCLLVLQAQVWASAVLGCRHATGLTAQPTAACHWRHAGPKSPEPAHPRLFDCHKCVLSSLVTVAVPAGSAPTIPEQCGPQLSEAGSGLHFYQFIPALPERPPRA